MSKSKKQKSKKAIRRANSPYASYNISSLDHHKRIGNKLVPPLAQMPMAKPSSWLDHHMPEMLWAVLLTGSLNREQYLNCFREVAAVCREWFLKKESGANGEHQKTPSDALNFTVIVDHTKLAEVSDEEFNKFLTALLASPLGRDALRPLLLLDCIPGYERWCKALAVEANDDDWNLLARSIAGVIDHQSEASTDIRWFKLVLPIISGRMMFPESEAERLEELRLFPYQGDMRSVRPFIRSGEMVLRRNPPSPWVDAFWSLAMDKTGCIDPSEGEAYAFIDTEINPDALYAARDEVVARFHRSSSSLRVDPKLDSAFGLALYALSTLEEIGLHRIQTRIIGAISLRALAEVSITLRYLAHIDTHDMWQSYRVYGAGQAKLAFLKLQQLQGDLPSFIDEDAIHVIANEDVWQEFLNIDVGHWANSNLRKLATECGAKDTYDRYYDWSSSFIHGNWAAVRDTNFVTCHNALHRLHRIPRVAHRTLSSVEPDCVDLVNEVISLLEQLYPSAEPIPRVSLRPVPPATGQG